MKSLADMTGYNMREEKKERGGKERENEKIDRRKDKIEKRRRLGIEIVRYGHNTYITNQNVRTYLYQFV